MRTALVATVLGALLFLPACQKRVVKQSGFASLTRGPKAPVAPEHRSLPDRETEEDPIEGLGNLMFGWLEVFEPEEEPAAEQRPVRRRAKRQPTPTPSRDQGPPSPSDSSGGNSGREISPSPRPRGGQETDVSRSPGGQGESGP